MANKRFLLGMLVIALALGMTVVGCEEDIPDDDTSPSAVVDTAFNGTWVFSSYSMSLDGETHGPFPAGYEAEIYFNNGNYEKSEDGEPWEKGIYTTNNGKITFTVTHIFNHDEELELKWYTINELKTAYIELYPEDEEDIEEEIDSHFAPETKTYSISGNTLSITTTETMDLGELGTFTYTQTDIYTRKN